MRTLRLTPSELKLIQARATKRPSSNKFGAVKETVDGIEFDSRHEADVYRTLKIQQMGGLIRDLLCHVPLRVEVNGQYVFAYEADFAFTDCDSGKHHYQDAKGYRKGAAYQLFRLKKAVIRAALGIDIEEV